MKPHPPHLKQAVYWITEREKIRRAKEAGHPPPWTKDERMATTRWCNVRRMDDKVSIWLMDNFYQRLTVKPSVKKAILAASLARLINRPETLARLCPKGFTDFNYEKFAKELDKMKKAGEQIFTGVYIINGANANGRPKWELVLDNLQKMSDTMEPSMFDISSMQATHKALTGFEGLGSFLAGQVVADLRHILPPDRWVTRGMWADRHDWAPVGPGSTKGLNYVFNTPGHRMSVEEFQDRLRIYRDALLKNPDVGAIHADRSLEAHDYQNTLCEVSKWARVIAGGRSKNRYRIPQPELF